MTRDWRAWHAAYDDPDSRLSRRLAVVQRFVADAIDARPPGPVRVLSMCAGEGRDIVGVARASARRADIGGRLVELDPTLAGIARRAAAAAGLDGLEVVCGDASTTDAYAGAVPADVVLACGIFGNVTAADVEQTVGHLPRLCAPGAWVVWTRHPRSPELIDDIRGWFEAAGFEHLGWQQEDGAFGVGCERLAGPPLPFEPGRRLFTFVGD